MVHRWLFSIESRGAEAEAELKTEALLQDLNDVASHASAQADLAEMVETAVRDLKVCQYMHPHIGEKLDARVLRVSRAGMEVELSAYNVTGFLPARTLGDRAEVKGPTLLIKRGRQARSFTEGHPIAVRLKDVDFLKLQILLDLA
jgi:exoribonuclease R